MNSLFADHLLTWIIAVPFLGMAVLAFVRNEHWIRRIAFACALLDFGLFLILWSGFDPEQQGMQFVERMQWMPTFNIAYAVGVDGISILLVLLTTLLCPICILCSWRSVNTNVRAFMMLILLVEGAMIVVFTALDLFLFFMMWEVTMIPMYFLIILWGGPGRIAAGLKFVLYSLTGSLLLLVGILAVHVEGGHTFDIIALTQQTYSSTAQLWMFLGVLPGVCHQIADAPISHVATRCPCRSPHGRQCYSGGDPFEDGRVWVLADLSPDVSGSLSNLCPVYSMAVGAGDFVRRLYGSSTG